MKLSFLINEGFTLKDALSFVATIMPKEVEWIEQIIKKLEVGERMDVILKNISFPERISAQIYLSMVHGNFSGTLWLCGKYIENKIKQQQQLFKLLQYPILLLGFMTSILLAMRMILLPNFAQLGISSSNQGTSLTRLSFGFIQYFPIILVLFSLSISISAFFISKQLKKRSALNKAVYFSKLPFIGSLFKLYYTHFFSFEWSQLFKSGLQMNDMLNLMQNKSATALMQETAYELEKLLKEGKSFTESLNQFSFFNLELGMIIRHGEATSQLGSELELYAQDCQQRLTKSIQNFFEWVQPLLFMLIAGFILCIYLALLLPMFDLLEEGMLL